MDGSSLISFLFDTKKSILSKLSTSVIKFFLFTLLATTLSMGDDSFDLPPLPKEQPGGKRPFPIESSICISNSLTEQESSSSSEWKANSFLPLRCPTPHFLKSDHEKMIILLNQKNALTSCLEVPMGYSDLLINEERQLAIVAIQIEKIGFVIYVVSLEKGKVWPVNIRLFDQLLESRKPLKDDKNRYAHSPFILASLVRYKNLDLIRGCCLHASALDQQDEDLSMLIHFTIRLDIPHPADGAPWPLTVTKLYDNIRGLDTTSESKKDAILKSWYECACTLFPQFKPQSKDKKSYLDDLMGLAMGPSFCFPFPVTSEALPTG